MTHTRIHFPQIIQSVTAKLIAKWCSRCFKCSGCFTKRGFSFSFWFSFNWCFRCFKCSGCFTKRGFSLSFSLSFNWCFKCFRQRTPLTKREARLTKRACERLTKCEARLTSKLAFQMCQLLKMGCRWRKIVE